VGRTERIVNVIVFVLATIAFGALCLLPAGQLRVGNDTTTFRMTDLLGLGYFLAAAALVLLIIGVLQMLQGDGLSKAAAWGFAGLTAVTLLSVIAIESIGRLVPRTLLPPTLRRFVLNLGVTAPPWIAVLLCVVATMCSRWGFVAAFRRVGRHDDETSAELTTRLCATAALVGGLLLMAISRNQSIAEVTFSDETIRVEPWAIPYLGPGSLLSLLLMLLATVCVAVRWRLGIACLVGGAVAWLSASVSGLMVATSGLIIESSATKWVIRQVKGADLVGDVDISSSSPPWIAYLGALLVGCAFVAALTLREDRA
jgi:hypothetical protein